MAHFFEIYGRFCAGHPLEVIVATFTLTACMLNMETGNSLLREGSLLNVTRCRHGKCDNYVSRFYEIRVRHYFHTRSLIVFLRPVFADVENGW